jgi:hypothetical protein
MPYEYTLPKEYAEEEITGVIAESIASHREFAQRRLAAYMACCTTFEQRYGMSTESFLERFEAGTLGDQPAWFDWYAAAQGKQIWSRKHTILAHLT